MKSSKMLPMLQPTVLFLLENIFKFNITGSFEKIMLFNRRSDLLVVHVCLGDIFDESDAKLDIGAVGEEVQPEDDTGEGEDEGDDNKDCNTCEDTKTSS